MPAYIRLLSYFSNFILLASFLGIGVGCLLAPARARLFAWFPVLTAAVIGAVYAFRLEVAIPPSASIYFTSGTSDPVLPVESTLLLPVLFVSGLIKPPQFQGLTEEWFLRKPYTQRLLIDKIRELLPPSS